MIDIEERANKHVRNSNLQRYFGVITPKEDYIKGATDQDPISRADEREKAIKKVCEYLDEHIQSVAYLDNRFSSIARPILGNDFIQMFKQSMEEYGTM